MSDFNQILRDAPSEFDPNSNRMANAKTIELETLFFIGDEEGADDFGLVRGPTPELNEMLAIPGIENACIIAESPNGSLIVLYRWRDRKWQKQEIPT